MKTICLVDPALDYPDDPPFHPAELFPELVAAGDREVGRNRVHGALRELFRAAGLDAARYGTPAWNPLGGIIEPGQHVVLKPNWVLDRRDAESTAGQLTTHSAVVRAMLDYVLLALKARGRITICDSPIQSASFRNIEAENHLEQLTEIGAGRPNTQLRIADLRQEEVVLDPSLSKIVDRLQRPGDPMGYAEIDLGAGSHLEELCGAHSGIRFSVQDYDEAVTNANHRSGVHRYSVSRSVLDADVFVNLPKMKTHAKAGVTGALKNLVGINGSKAHLVHFHQLRDGSGDEFARSTLKSRVARFADVRLKPVFPVFAWSLLRKAWRRYKGYLRRSAGQGGGAELLSYGGGWWGNRTIWRMVYDLNAILLFADKQGRMRDEPQRRYLALVDGIVGCEGEGPLHGAARRDGVLILGDDPVSVDACMADLMGFDGKKIPLVAEAGRIGPRWRFSRYSGGRDYERIGAGGGLRPFVPPLMWKGHVEKG